MRLFRGRKNHNLIHDNNGSTLITVIVAIAFVTILVTIILGTTVVNVRMKGIDRRTKDDFYYAERSLNDIYTGLGQELAVIAGDEYEAAFKKVGTVEGLDDFNMAETAEKDFRKKFMKKVHDTLIGLDEATLQQYVLTSSKGHVDKIGAKEYQKKNGESALGEEDAYRFVLKDVQVSVTDASGYRSVISTDIVITIPTVDFLGTNADVSDYGLIANKGLYIEGNSEITGNVYAGVHSTAISQDADYDERTDEFSRTPVYGGINIKNGKAIFDGNYIISKGDINLAGTNPQIKVNSPAAGADVNLANLWFTSIRTISDANITPIPTPTPSPLEPTIDINANIFALNDMTLNADNSSVVIKGNYYGYNDGGSGITDVLGKKSGRDDAVNSAIIINGSKAYLDMRDINNFVLMGKAYVDFTSDTETNAAGTATQVVPTAESVALKTNQQLYLVPPDFLDGPNPVQGGSGVFTLIPTADLQKWFGYDYLDASRIHEKYKVSTSGGDVYYDYLVFNDSVNWKPSDSSTLGTDTENEKYIVNKNTSDGTYKIVKYTRSTESLGTGGSISSKAMFFLKIMTARNEYEYRRTHGDPDATGRSESQFIEYKESLIEQHPSAYRLNERINLSMGYEYFDLSQCVVGNLTAPADAHYYAKNAVVNYERDASDKIQSNVLNNTDGMLRYSGYTQNLYNRYIFLCTELDGKEDKLLEAADLGTPKMGEWVVDSPAPISHFVKLDNIGTMAITDSIDAATDEGLKPGAFGVCIAQNTDLDLGSVPAAALTSGTFKGVAIVDGNITVPTNMKVDGLLMATGTITLKGNNKINYNKGLIQSRIEKEMNIVKNKDAGVADAYKNYYLINYLSKDNTEGNPELIYQVDAGSKIKRDRIEADYNDFVHYENWQKGEK
jgi:hypothetical protein